LSRSLMCMSDLRPFRDSNKDKPFQALGSTWG
jgi:hypothetical protein